MTKKPVNAVEQLKRKLYKIRLLEDRSKVKKHFDTKEFVKMAKEVRKTFKKDDILSPNPNI